MSPPNVFDQNLLPFLSIFISKTSYDPTLEVSSLPTTIYPPSEVSSTELANSLLLPPMRVLQIDADVIDVVDVVVSLSIVVVVDEDVIGVVVVVEFVPLQSPPS